MEFSIVFFNVVNAYVVESHVAQKTYILSEYSCGTKDCNVSKKNEFLLLGI